MAWKEIGIWAAGVVAALTAGGFAIKIIRNKTVSTTVKTTQTGNIVGRDMAGRDNISNNQK